MRESVKACGGHMERRLFSVSDDDFPPAGWFEIVLALVVG